MLLKLGPEGEFERKRIARLVNLRHSDAAFFLLACHSYIESWLRQKFHMWEDDHSFGDLVFKFKIELIQSAKTFPKELSVLQTLRTKEKTAQAVQHHFVEISPEEASASAYRLLQFCKLAGMEYPELSPLRSSLELWEDRKISPVQSEGLADLRRQLAESRIRNKQILDEVEELRQYRSEVKHYSLQIRYLESEIELLMKNKNPAAACDLNTKKIEAELKKTTSSRCIKKLSSAELYLASLSRLSGYTRTRFDFERDITRLTPEQQQVLDLISLSDDFLVKGGAGTGKTLVLIKALEKALSIDKAELSFSEKSTKVRLLTFNRTLAKYDRYLAAVLRQEEDAEMISTVDKFLYDRLRLINEDNRIIYSDSYAAELAAPFNTTDAHDDSELAHEIENIIFAGDLSKEAYIGKKSAGRGEREEIWKIRGLVIKKMRAESAFTKNYSRIVILEYLKGCPDEAVLRDTDFIFIDEVQDLAAVDIKAVKACTRRSVIMAGDSDQSIYQSGFTFARGGIDIRGTTKILKTNFRNTLEIHELAESYRNKSAGKDKETQPVAFRTGPSPELYTGENKDELVSMMIKRVALFTNELDYDPENICILLPSGKDIEPIRQQLAASGFQSHDLRTDDFSFSERNIVRISTMHSSKGLDFPVVLLCLHKLPQTSAAHDQAAREKMRRNLIYVSVTRAMDHVNIFILDGEDSPEIKDLAAAFGRPSS
ncbi:MAG: DEAD/DEAH box helicase [Spirochaetales bacterium]|nr:DEAD/DEAH box helicase [Spirochaetales bacterium]